MEEPKKSDFRTALKSGIKDMGSQIRFWLIALFIGVAAGLAALLFRKTIDLLQSIFYGAQDFSLATTLAQSPWWIVVCVPILGGLVVGWILQKFTPDGRVRSMSHVIEGAAINNGRVEGRAGLASALASVITLSTGGSTGREGPVVHLGAVIASKVSRAINADGITARDLMGCAAAAAVAASFNAPIAGALFALEVVLRHFAVHAFAPIVIASVSGAVVSRANFGNILEFSLPTSSLEFYVELPAFLLLGLICGIVAACLVYAIFWAEDLADKWQSRVGLSNILRPAVAGGMLGCIALGYPHIIGVGYETTASALAGDLLFWNVIVFAIVKAIAVAITMAGRMGGGIFSPALMIGALTGLAFGIVATGLFPDTSSTQTLYALAGMGAVAAAVLGAPISTTLIVFEMTGDWQTGLAVMVAVSLSTALASRLMDRSFFLTQLERRGIHIAQGPQGYLPATIKVSSLMREPSKRAEKRAWKLIAKQVYLRPDDTLETALPLYDKSKNRSLPIVTAGGPDAPLVLVGMLKQVDAYRALNMALSDIAAEEHS
jgi:CIC family chloride channel protein